ncbi:hypothetical protein [Senegalia massiliensis]|uniref:hypothetical protein n=1 Tax=Senegalia massiliensis TaxID=1720316 RepID=UPI001032138F|nr:hypothetical protein [Senegalia massiliensis]
MRNNYKFILVMIFTFFISFTMLIVSNNSYADDIEIIGKDLGLVIESSREKFFDFQILNPGDIKKGSITLKNDYEYPFNLYMKAERIGEIDSVDLLNQLILQINYDGELIFEGSMNNFAKENIYLGKLEMGDVQKLDATVKLPGPETGNEFQGKKVDVKWIFTAQTERVLGEYDGPNEEVVDEQEVVDDGVTYTPKMPQTGEMIPYLLYGVGISSLLIGIILKFKK